MPLQRENMPKPLKNFILMFIASLATFMLLSYVDEYENLVAPFFRKNTRTKKAQSINQDFMSLIKAFNISLSQVYQSSDPSKVNMLPASDAVKRVIAEEIGFLMKSGKVMELNAEPLRIEKVDKVSPEITRVRTAELVSVRYLNYSDRSVITPEKVAEYHMVYTFEDKNGKLTLTGYETRGVNQ